MKDPSGAPGLKRRVRKDGTVAFYWVASAVSRQAAGYQPSTVRIHGTGSEVAAMCRRLTAEMQEWLGQRDKQPIYAGDIASLIRVYRMTEGSPFHRLKYNSRCMYEEGLDLLTGSVGHWMVADVTGLEARRWYDNFKRPAKPGGPERVRRAFKAMQMLRIVVKFGIVANISDCFRLNTVLEVMEFSAPPPRTERITFDQVQAFCAKAIELGRVSMAQAQALQFELTLRQADVIGQWEPAEADAGGIVDRKQRWSGGVAWNHIDADGKLVKETTKQLARDRVHVAEHDTTAYPFLRSMLDLTPPERRFGPIIIDEGSGLPYRYRHYSRLWRKIADEVGIPANVWNRDSRAGGVTEGSDAGADIEHLRHHATHSNVQTTGRYNRGTIEKTRKVAQLRVAHRGAKND